MAQNGLGRVLNRLKHKDKDEDNVYEEEIINILNEGHEQGAIQKEEAEMISKIFEFSDKDAKDIMTIRKRIVGVERHMPLREAVPFILEQNYSRFPLYDEDIDNVIGVLHLKDVMKAYLSAPETELSMIAQEAYYVHEAQDISSMFSEMQSKKQHMAIVVDEYGQTSGIVAMEDILEVIVGNILDEHDVEEREITKLRQDGEYLIRGLTRLDRISEELDITFPDEDIDTLNGFLIYMIGHLPTADEAIDITYQGYSFRPLDIHDNMIVQVKVCRVLAESDEV
jgi:putative hemolysin